MMVAWQQSRILLLLAMQLQLRKHLLLCLLVILTSLQALLSQQQS
jgi:hypothetical protein